MKLSLFTIQKSEKHFSHKHDFDTQKSNCLVKTTWLLFGFLPVFRAEYGKEDEYKESYSETETGDALTKTG